MKDQQTEAALRDSNLAVLANAVQLCADVVLDIAGNDIANTIDGKLVTSDFLQEACATNINSAITPSTGDR